MSEPLVIEVPLTERQVALFRELERNLQQAQLALNVFCTALFAAVDGGTRVAEIHVLEAAGEWRLRGVAQP
jgi:hypothetical protein